MKYVDIFEPAAIANGGDCAAEENAFTQSTQLGPLIILSSLMCE